MRQYDVKFLGAYATHKPFTVEEWLKAQDRHREIKSTDERPGYNPPNRERVG